VKRASSSISTRVERRASKMDGTYGEGEALCVDVRGVLLVEHVVKGGDAAVLVGDLRKRKKKIYDNDISLGR
jgi:hypothetical protein